MAKWELTFKTVGNLAVQKEEFEAADKHEASDKAVKILIGKNYEYFNLEEKTEKDLTCPRCKQPTMDPVPHRNALSRVDNKTYICDTCGMAEALGDLFNNL